MTAPNILTDTTPVLDPDHSSIATCVITDAWGLFFAQGGVVMAAALRAMELVLDRPDLTLASASTTFCRPVACGPVATTVDVLRSGRRGAQVYSSLSDQTAPAGATSVATTAVFTDSTLPGPVRAPLVVPIEFRDIPTEDDDNVVGPDSSRFPLGFLDNTEWRLATAPGVAALDEGPIPRAAVWFRFANPPAAPGVAWDSSLLAIPGDALGSALVVALGEGERPVGSVSLQIGIQVVAPIVGTWIGIDSTCTHVGDGLASGVLHLWSENGTHVATVTQTAMLRSLDGSVGT